MQGRREFEGVEEIEVVEEMEVVEVDYVYAGRCAACC
jgi:hypothetical protein